MITIAERIQKITLLGDVLQHQVVLEWRSRSELFHMLRFLQLLVNLLLKMQLFHKQQQELRCKTPSVIDIKVKLGFLIK